MEQQRCNAETAFAVLREASQNRNIKLQTVAADLIETMTGPVLLDLGRCLEPGMRLTQRRLGQPAAGSAAESRSLGLQPPLQRVAVLLNDRGRNPATYPNIDALLGSPGAHSLQVKAF